DQTTGLLSLASDLINLQAAVYGEAEMAVIVCSKMAINPAGHDHEDELMFFPRLGHPYDLRTFARSLMDHPHTAELLIEVDAGLQVGNMQGDMGQARAHIRHS